MGVLFLTIDVPVKVLGISLNIKVSNFALIFALPDFFAFA